MSGWQSVTDALGWSGGPDPKDEISIVIGSQRIVGWQTVSITRSVEQFPNSFTLTGTDQFPYAAGQTTALPSGAYDVCSVFIGSDLVITGYVDHYTTAVSPASHQTTIVGRGLCRELTDCSADLLNSLDLNGGTVRASNTRDLAQKLAKPFGITAYSAVDDLGKPLQPITIANGETSYQVLERVARYTGYLIYEDEAGALVLDRVGTKSMASGFTMPGNIESATSTLSTDQRFSDYAVVWNTINQLSDLSPLANQRALVKDPNVSVYRPMIIVSEQLDPDVDLGKKRASWEYARRIGRSQAINLTCDSWRDTAGKLWQPNYLAPIDAAALKITNAQWLIGSVVFRKDQSGTHADIQMMPADAFSVEPASLYLWDREIMHAQEGQTDGPPSTSPPGTGLRGSV